MKATLTKDIKHFDLKKWQEVELCDCILKQSYDDYFYNWEEKDINVTELYWRYSIVWFDKWSRRPIIKKWDFKT